MNNRPGLEAIEARANKATQGPWKKYVAKHIAVVKVYGSILGITGILNSIDARDEKYDLIIADSEFIAHARQDIPDLVAYARNLEAELKKLREIGNRIVVGMDHMDQCQECGNGSADQCLWGGTEAMRAKQAWTDEATERKPE